jgi:hypothetical protein
MREARLEAKDIAWSGRGKSPSRKLPLNRRMPNGMYCGVRGRRLVTASYSIKDAQGDRPMPPKEKPLQKKASEGVAHGNASRLVMKSCECFHCACLGQQVRVPDFFKSLFFGFALEGFEIFG